MSESISSQRQQRMLSSGNLIDAAGGLAQTGYSKQAVATFNRSQIKAAPWRIKEWDFYQISNERYCLQMTIGHVSYAGTVSATLFEFATGRRYSATRMLTLPFNKLRMPASAETGDLAFKKAGFEMEFHIETGARRLRCTIQGDAKTPAMDIDIHLTQPDLSSIVIATPFDEDRRMFYYNHKINCMPASGTAVIGDQTFVFEPDSAFGLLDWGRGVWPFRHSWNWGNGSGLINGKRFGFNIGYGFGNTSAATENMLFYDGVAHKIGEVYFDLTTGGFMAPKRFSSSDGRFEMLFTPVYDNYTATKMLFVDNSCHQVFGTFSGTAVLDDGTALDVKNLFAFAEYAVNRW